MRIFAGARKNAYCEEEVGEIGKFLWYLLAEGVRAHARTCCTSCVPPRNVRRRFGVLQSVGFQKVHLAEAPLEG